MTRSRSPRKAFAVRFAGASGPKGPTFRLLARDRADATRQAERLGYAGYQDIVPYGERDSRPRVTA